VVRLDKRLVEAELKIATGLVEPHFMAGWSGGRKVISPGIAHAETITTFHNAEFMSNPRAANCVLEGNPLHEEQLAIVEMLGGALALNTVRMIVKYITQLAPERRHLDALIAQYEAG